MNDSQNEPPETDSQNLTGFVVPVGRTVVSLVARHRGSVPNSLSESTVSPTGPGDPNPGTTMCIECLGELM
jgi:hypothetical protein